jgi:hypothetical protein
LPVLCELLDGLLTLLLESQASFNFFHWEEGEVGVESYTRQFSKCNMAFPAVLGTLRPVVALGELEGWLKRTGSCHVSRRNASCSVD